MQNVAFKFGQNEPQRTFKAYTTLYRYHKI